MIFTTKWWRGLDNFEGTHRETSSFTNERNFLEGQYRICHKRICGKKDYNKEVEVTNGEYKSYT